MSKLRSNAPKSQPPVTTLPENPSSSRYQRAGSHGKDAVVHGDPLPWLIRQLRGRYDEGQIATPAAEQPPGDLGDTAAPEPPPQ